MRVENDLEADVKVLTAAIQVHRAEINQIVREEVVPFYEWSVKPAT